MSDKIYHLFKRYVFNHLPDPLFYNISARYSSRQLGLGFRRINLRKPQTFSDKVSWLKKHYRFAEGGRLADKYAVREYIAETVGSEYLVPLLGVWDNANDIDFDTLPQSFVLKATHGSGMNVICGDKSSLDIPATRERLNKWLGMNFYPYAREWQYRDIAPRIIAEEFLEYGIYDYKFFCFAGVPQFVQIDIDRFTNHTRSFYDMEWRKQPFTMQYPLYTGSIPKPEGFAAMKEIAAALSEGHPFIRVDLYNHNGRVYFGELTLHPAAGYGPFIPEKYDRTVGSMIPLPVQNSGPYSQNIHT